MPIYFMHLVDSVDMTLDPDGTEMPTDTIADATLRQARDCMAGDVKTGRLDLRYRIDVHNEGGALVHSLPFAEALKIIDQESQ